MTDAAAFRATYSDLRLVKGRKVLQLVFEVPLEGANEAMAALGGMPNPASEVWCAIARLDLEAIKQNAGAEPAKEGGAPVPAPLTADIAASAPASRRSEPSIRKPVAQEKRLAQRAGILCADPMFRRFLRVDRMQPVLDENDAARVLRLICHVQSRADIIPETDAGRTFDQLYSQFIIWRDADAYLEQSATGVEQSA